MNYYYMAMTYRIVFFLFFIGILVQSRTKSVISSRDDFKLLEERERFEYEYSLHEGIKYKLFGDFDRAVFFFERCLDLFPYSDLAYYELSDIYYTNDNIDISVEYALAALNIDPLNIWYYYQLARIYRENGYEDEAIGVYERAILNFPDNYDIYFSLAAIHLNNKNYISALELYDGLERIIGVDERISVSREQIYMELGEFEKAYNEIQYLIDNFPGEPRYYGMLAELYSSLGMYSEALDNYQKLFRLDPENGIAQLSVAEFFLDRGDFEDAFVYIVTAFRNPRLVPEEKIQVINFLIQNSDIFLKNQSEIEQLGLILIEDYPENQMVLAVMSDFFVQSGNYKRAGELLLDLYETDGENEMFAEQLINILSIGEDYEKIIELSEDILEKFPDNLTINYFAGVAHHLNGREDEAVDILLNLARHDNITSEIKVHVYTYLGDIFFKKEEFDRSFKYLQDAIDIDSTNVIALNNYAYYLSLREEKLELALRYSYKTINEQPDNPSFLDTYAWILYKMGNLDNALEYIELAYNKGGEQSYEIVKHYAKILISLGRISEAREYLSRALDLTDDPDEIRAIILSVD